MSGNAQALDLGSKTARWLELKDGKRGLQLTGFAAGPKDSANLGRASGPARPSPIPRKLFWMC